MEALVTESEGIFLRDAFEDAPFEFWMRDADGRCVVQNAAARKWGDLRGLRVEESPVPPALIAVWQASNRRAYAGELVQHEVECHLDGETLYYECVVVPVRTCGEVRSILGFNIDVSERKRAEQALRESERRLRDAMKVGRMGYLDWDLRTNEMQWSPETYRLFGYAPETGFLPTIETTVGMVPEEDRAWVQPRLDAVIRGDAPYDIDHRVIRGDGRVIHVHAQGEVTRDADGAPLRMLGTVVDVTERKEAEKALRISEERLKQALKASSAGIWERDFLTGEERWSTENFDLYGLDPGANQPTFAAWEALIHPDDRASVSAAVQDAIAGTATEVRAEFRIRHPRGERWLLSFGQVKRAPDETPVRMSGISIDITERRRAEEALKKSETLFRKLIEAAPEAVSVARPDRIVYANPRYLQLLGYDEFDELSSKSVLDLVHPEDRPGLDDRRRHLFESPLGIPGETRELRLLCKGGGVITAECSSMPIDFEGSLAILTFLRDVTNRKHEQARLIQTDRMAQLGTLAAGVAHEINNPLGYLLLNLEGFGRDLDALVLDPDAHARLGARLAMVREGASHITTIVRDLLNFCRPDSPPQPLDVRQVLESAINMATPEVVSRGRLVRDYAPVPPVLADGARLGQVFLNLLLNAAQALEPNTARENEIRVTLRSEDSTHVKVAISDTGHGITQEHLGRIFEPFFTTRSPGTGTGLGLSISQNIVHRMNGQLTVESAVGCGSTFSVRLPASV